MTTPHPADRVRQAANVVFAISQAALPALAPRLGNEIGALSDQHPTYVTPASYAFGIWSLIFTLAFLYALHQARPSRAADATFRRIGWLTALAFLGNTAWEAVFPQRRLVLANAIIVLVLAALVLVQRGLLASPPPRSRTDRVLVDGTCGLLLGWITVATIANTALTLTAGGWDGGPLPPVTRAVVLLVTAAAITAWTVTRIRSRTGFALASAWGLAAIAVARFTGEPALPSRGLAALAAAAALAPLAALVLRARRAHPRDELAPRAAPDRA